MTTRSTSPLVAALQSLPSDANLRYQGALHSESNVPFVRAVLIDPYLRYTPTTLAVLSPYTSLIGQDSDRPLRICFSRQMFHYQTLCTLASANLSKGVLPASRGACTGLQLDLTQ